MTIERDEVVKLIDRMKTVRPTCDKCETRCYSEGALDKPLADGLLATGWEHDVNRAGWMRRCAECKKAFAFPWADKLDIEKVQAFINSDPRCEHAFETRILEETL